MVLPTPEPPLISTLAPRSAKSSAMSRSISGRSIARGCAQSKRSSGLQVPRQAVRVRRARLTVSRARSSRSASCSRVSVGLTRLLWRWVRKAAKASRGSRKPRRRRRSLRSSSFGIVALQIVRNDDVVVVDVEIGQDGNRPVAPRAVGLTGDGERAEIGETALREVGDRGGEDLISVQVEELDRAGDAKAEAGAGRGPARQQLTEGWRDRVEAVAALEIARGAPLRDQLDSMGRILDDLASAPG